MKNATAAVFSSLLLISCGSSTITIPPHIEEPREKNSSTASESASDLEARVFQNLQIIIETSGSDDEIKEQVLDMMRDASLDKNAYSDTKYVKTTIQVENGPDGVQKVPVKIKLASLEIVKQLSDIETLLEHAIPEETPPSSTLLPDGGIAPAKTSKDGKNSEEQAEEAYENRRKVILISKTIDEYYDVAKYGMDTARNRTHCDPSTNKRNKKTIKNYWNVSRKTECNDSASGYIHAQYVQKDGGSCGFGLYKQDIKARKSIPFISAYKKWWEFWGGDKECKEPVIPVKCILGSCWGKNFSTGFTIRPSINLGTAIGKGLGFDDSFGFNAQVSASIMGRLFFLGDMLDLRFGIGAGAISIVEEDQDSSDKKTMNFMLSSFGIGTFHGLIGLNIVWCMNPWLDDSGESEKYGWGVSLYIDLAAMTDIYSDNSADVANKRQER